MRKGDQIAGTSRVENRPLAADDIGEGFEFEKLGNSELADRKDQAWLENFEFASQPMRAGFDFLLVRHAITAQGILARKAAADGGKIDP